MNPLANVRELTPERLTAIFDRPNHPVRATRIQVTKSVATPTSNVHHLAIEYESPAGAAPTHLFLKIPYPDATWMDKEVQFYREIAPMMQGRDALFIPYYDIGYDVEAKTCHFLMEDLSVTYFTIDEMMKPTLEHYEQVVDGFARFHAFWWEHPDLGRRFGERMTETILDETITRTQRKLADFIAFAQNRVPDETLALLKMITARWPERRRKRVLSGEGVTLVHRDPHPYNFLYPRGQGTARIIDWQSWRVDTGTDDLAYMIACHWSREQRGEFEEPLLRRYQERLSGEGVVGYDWEDCRYDYQASILRCISFLVNAWSSAQWESGIWWPRIQRALEAFQTWECAEIL